MTAGERERESLEPLLMNPLPRIVVVMGKYVAGLSFTFLATALATTIFPLLLRIPQIQEFTGIRVNISPGMLITALLIILPVVFMAVAIEMLIASYARSIKEAQNYVQLIALAGFMPSIFLSVLPVKANAVTNLIPTVAQQFLINKITRGEALSLPDVAVSTTITLIIAVVALMAAVRLYNQERIVLGK
jgi:sodium transport system permease protein